MNTNRQVPGALDAEARVVRPMPSYALKVAKSEGASIGFTNGPTLQHHVGGLPSTSWCRVGVKSQKSFDGVQGTYYARISRYTAHVTHARRPRSISHDLTINLIRWTQWRSFERYANPKIRRDGIVHVRTCHPLW